MKITLPILKQDFVDGEVVTTETERSFVVDTSVYSEERWEMNFPALAQKESLFQYIERIENAESTLKRSRIISLLKAVYCFIEPTSGEMSYKEFAQLFSVSDVGYTERLVDTLTSAFNAILNSSATKN